MYRRNINERTNILSTDAAVVAKRWEEKRTSQDFS